MAVLADFELETALRQRYRGRPDRLAEVLANAVEWERLRAVAAEDVA